MFTYGYGGIAHDASAVLLHDGKVVGAMEEERLNRIKHTGKAPFKSMDFCIQSYGVSYSDVDRFVLTTGEYEANVKIREYFFYHGLPYTNIKDYIIDTVRHYHGVTIDRSKIVFVDHHTCHAASTYYMSGFDRSLIFTIDGASPEGFAGYVISADGTTFDILDRVNNDNSLGSYYLYIIRLLGYFQHDEYKVMGLAPYGDPKRFRKYLKKTYQLLPDGKFQVNFNWCMALFDLITPRKKGEPFTQEHKDLAAALQEALEVMVMHVLTHYRQVTGHTKLCLSGGVAHNCSMNGKILYSGLFDEVFVQPAAHDAGNSLGGALYMSKLLQPEIETETLRHLYWGTNIGNQEELAGILAKWEPFVSYTKVDRIEETAARLIAEGAVIGWVQGRSEFGPRALGNRSILADPRPEENKHIINAMVKKREGYRPFAPSVLEEYVGDYYVIPSSKAPLSYMNFVLQTKEDKQSELGAVTHVDGTARVQTVSRETNERYWTLIDEFRKLTGIPILLNTSFNNNAEPIVDSEEDAIVSFLTTNIHYLIIGDYLISKKEAGRPEHLQLVPRMLITTELRKSTECKLDGQKRQAYVVRLHFGDKYDVKVSEETFRLLEACDGERSVDVLLRDLGIACEEKVIEELLDLWSRRLVAFTPSPVFAGKA
ncbi:carbamoyltransferase family protein [Gorillibacterium sp. sgz500922]|uniref:carbamoyltransferase family protein n=1 Tax=Gorillibacterium sp. sgz500922 TaxID=3446694 RepID=UPI003F67BD28